MDIVTLDQILNISNTIRNIASKSNVKVLLNDYDCRNYNIVECKKKLMFIFNDIRKAKYLYNFPEESIRITSNITERGASFQKSASSPVEKIIDRYIDDLFRLTDLYNVIIKTSHKLTNDESVYLINTFLENSYEEEIAEIIGISKTSLQKIKKSCIVKLWVGLRNFVEED